MTGDIVILSQGAQQGLFLRADGLRPTAARTERTCWGPLDRAGNIPAQHTLAGPGRRVRLGHSL